MKRSYTPEIMDDLSIKDKRIDNALKELKAINFFLGGNSTTKSGIKEVLKVIPGNKNIKILDAGSGASDNLSALNNPLINFQIFSLDINIRACYFIKKSSRYTQITCGDILQFPYKNECCEIVHVSLFLHHFSENKVEEIIKSLYRSSKYAVVINDLRRSILAYIGIKVLTALFSRSPMVKNDAPLSVKRAFSKNELLNIISNLKIERFTIKRKWAFRWLVILYKNDKAPDYE